MIFRKRTLLLLIPLLVASLACQAASGVWQTASVPTSTTVVYPTNTSLPTPIPPTPIPSLAATETHVQPSPTASPTLVPPTLAVTLAPAQQPTPSALQAKVFEELWNVVNKNYLYRDFNGLDWNAVHSEYMQKIQAGMTDEAFYQSMHELIHSLKDDHSNFFSPSEVKIIDAEYTGNYDYVGIGVFANAIAERDRATITLIFPGSPAEAAGIKIHDSILAVNGQPILNQGKFQRSLLLGPEGTTVELTVQSPGESPRQVQVTRRRIDTTLPVPYSVLTTPDGKHVGYIYLPTFLDKNIPNQVRQAIETMNASAPLDGLILDNRQNGGGSSDVMEKTLSYFANGPMGNFVQRSTASPLNISGLDINGSQKVPLAVLVSKQTASFGEIFSGILKDTGRATVIGEPSMGNVEILSIYNFFDGSRAWIAQLTFHPVNHPDQIWEGTGIIPDVTVTSNWDEVNSENDPVIQAALAHFDKVN